LYNDWVYFGVTIHSAFGDAVGEYVLGCGGYNVDYWFAVIREAEEVTRER
jgi:hypothetical protein